MNLFAAGFTFGLVFAAVIDGVLPLWALMLLVSLGVLNLAIWWMA